MFSWPNSSSSRLTMTPWFHQPKQLDQRGCNPIVQERSCSQPNFWFSSLLSSPGSHGWRFKKNVEHVLAFGWVQLGIMWISFFGGGVRNANQTTRSCGVATPPQKKKKSAAVSPAKQTDIQKMRYLLAMVICSSLIALYFSVRRLLEECLSTTRSNMHSNKMRPRSFFTID